MTKYNDVKDIFDLLRFELNDKISKCEELLEEKKKYENYKTGKEVSSLLKIQKDIKNLLKAKKRWRFRRKRKYN